MKNLLLITLVLIASIAKAQSPFKVFDFNTAVSGSSYPASYCAFNGKLYLVCKPISSGPYYLASTDGISTTDTIFNTGMSNSGPRNTVACNGKLYFAGKAHDTDAIYSYDGTNTPTVVFRNKPATTNSIKPIAYMVALNNIIYFVSADNTGNGQLWSYNTTNGASAKISSFTTINTAKYLAQYLTVYNSKIYFACEDACSLCEYNPATSNLAKVASSNATFVSSFVIYNGTLYYMGLTSAGSTAGYYELLSFNGTTAAILTSHRFSPPTGSYCYIGAINNFILISGWTTSSPITAIYKYDIAAHTTTLLKNMTTDYKYPDYFTEYNGLLYFNAYSVSEGGFNLWRCDGINDPSIVYYSASSGATQPALLNVFNNCLFFSGRDATAKEEVLRYYQPKASITNVTLPGTASISPNPTQNNTTLEINLKESQTLSISLTDINGREVYNIPSKSYNASRYSINLPTQNLSSGTYFYRINDASGRLLASGKLLKD